MIFEYTVRKKRSTRITYRTLGVVIFSLPLLYAYLIIIKNTRANLFLGLLCSFFFAYGLYLFKMSFRQQAYDIGYKFLDDTFFIKSKNKETQFSYDDVDFITMIIPDDSMMYYIINLSVKGKIYIIPFINRQDKCESLYNHIDGKVKTKD